MPAPTWNISPSACASISMRSASARSGSALAGETRRRRCTQARHAESFRRRERLAGRVLAINSVRSGAGIEQHADHGEVDARLQVVEIAARRSTPPASKCRQRL
ncbi:MAG: hypothetical protein U1F41_10135 [Burkholderiales bacterium]